VVDTFALRDGVSVPVGKALLYMATEDNEHFMPAEPLEHMAHRIARASGYSIVILRL
jgi:cation transport regulator ChaC